VSIRLRGREIVEFAGSIRFRARAQRLDDGRRLYRNRQAQRVQRRLDRSNTRFAIENVVMAKPTVGDRAAGLSCARRSVQRKDVGPQLANG
jgi:hypothetical protein